MHRNIFFASLAAAFVTGLLGACANTSANAPPNAVGADRDAHGCIGSAGYSWCEYAQRCERPWELAKEKGFASSQENFARYCSTGSAE
jgi:hypothetical protein